MITALWTIIASALAFGLKLLYVRFVANRDAEAQAKANAETAEKYKHEAEIYAAPRRSLADIIASMRSLRDK